MISGWIEQNRTAFEGQILKDEKLSKYTYYKIGGIADYFVTPKSESDLNWLHKLRLETGCDFTLIGLGSNVLISDSGVRGVVVRLTKLNLEFRLVEANKIFVGASVPISLLLRSASLNGWKGLEFLAGIPGSIGGAVYMNAGTHLGETVSKLIMVSVFNFETGQSRCISGTELCFTYRNNLFLGPGDCVLSTIWSVLLDDPVKVQAQINDVLLRRKLTQPIELPSCGSVFKNPQFMSAWEVIEKLGLRGYRLGGAQFSEKHANFIINTGNASAVDVKGLIDLAKQRGLNELNVVLQEEVQYLGSF